MTPQSYSIYFIFSSWILGLQTSCIKSTWSNCYQNTFRLQSWVQKTLFKTIPSLYFKKAVHDHYIKSFIICMRCNLPDSKILYSVCLFVCLFRFYGISTFVGYLMPNSFLYKWIVLFQAIQFHISIHLNV